MKSRTNKAGKTVNLVYDQHRGFDPMLTLLEYTTDKGLIDGRNPKRYFKGYEDVKFDARKFGKALEENPDLSSVMVKLSIKELITELEDGSEENKMSVGQYLDILENVMSEV